MAAGAPGAVRGARGGLAGAPVGDLDAQHFVVAGDPQLVRALGVQAGVGDELGDDQQYVLGGSPPVGGRGGQPAPRVQRLAGEIAGEGDDPARAVEVEPTDLTGGRVRGPVVSGLPEAPQTPASGPRSPGG